MRLVLEILSGRLAGQKKWLKLGERMRIGRTEQAELAVPDPKMSGVHFFVECSAAGCRVHDMRSANGTFLNGTKIDDAVLHHGDTIVAGDTQFRIQITDASAAEPSAQPPQIAVEGEHPAHKISKTVVTARPDAGGLAQESHAGAAEAPKVRGVAEVRNFPGSAQAAVKIAARLGEMSPLYLVFDFAKVAKPLPETVSKAQFLYDFVPEKLAVGFSPAVISGTSLIDWQELFELGWGHNCGLCVFSTLPEEDLVRRLRDLTLTDIPQTRRKYACPETLANLLSNGPDEFVTGLFNAADAVLFEADSADVCRLLTSLKLSPQVRGLGLDAMSD